MGAEREGVRTVELTLTSLAYGGKALGRLPDGRALFAPYALPGETVRVRLIKEKRGYVEAELVEVLAPSPQRIAPRCRHFAQCGGCHYQHMDYAAQLAAKAAILREQLVRLGGLSDPPVAQTIPSPQPWRYRNHMQFHRAPDGRLGFQATRANQVIPITECHLPEPALDAAWRGLSGAPLAGEARIGLRVGADGTIQQPGGEPVLMRVLGRDFQVSPPSFFQVNTAMAGRMVEFVLEQLASGASDNVIDLYCGVGLFGAFLAPRVARLAGVEASPSACADFRVNLAAFGNVTLYAGDAEAMLAGIEGPVTGMVADPPRAGLGAGVVSEIVRLAPARFVYVSCDPATLGRDARLLSAGGYRLARATPFDLFPQTYHIESISVWVRV